MPSSERTAWKIGSKNCEGLRNERAASQNSAMGQSISWRCPISTHEVHTACVGTTSCGIESRETPSLLCFSHEFCINTFVHPIMVSVENPSGPAVRETVRPTNKSKALPTWQSVEPFPFRVDELPPSQTAHPVSRPFGQASAERSRLATLDPTRTMRSASEARPAR